jgi:GTP:adenosylcobinamide-phosphate guanylyltransferase
MKTRSLGGDVPLAIMAGGKGMRLTNGSTSKPLFKVQGKALIDYVLDAAIEARIKEVHVIIRPDDRDLQAHLETFRDAIPDVQILRSKREGTGGASTQLMESIGERDHVLAPCDVICRPSDLETLIVAGQTKLDRQTDMALLALTRKHGMDQPIWVDVDNKWRIIRYGKNLPAQKYSWGNLRYCTSRFCREAIAYKDRPELRDTTICAELLHRFPGTFHGIPMPYLFDVDTPEEARWDPVPWIA